MAESTVIVRSRAVPSVIVACNTPPRSRRFTGSTLELGNERGVRLAPPVGVLEAALELDALPVAERVALVIGVEAVVRAVGAAS